MLIDQMKDYVVESARVYLPKVASVYTLLGIGWMETVDWTIRIVISCAGIVISIYTVWRLKVDIDYRKEELREKRLKNNELESKIKKYYE